MPITTDVVISNPAQGDVYSIQHYMIQFVSDFEAGRWLSPGPTVSPTIKTDRHDITEILWSRINLQYASKRTKNERTLHTNDTKNTRNERTIHERTIRKTQTNERTIHERTNHWSVAIYYPMTNDPGSIKVQYSIVLLFE